MLLPPNKILLGTIVGLLLVMAASQVYLFYKIQTSGNQINTHSASNASPNQAASQQGSDSSPTGVGQGIVFDVGPIKAISQNSITLSVDGGNKTIPISADTSVFTQGAMKSTADQQKDLDAYTSEYQSLLKDPQVNKEKIRLLILPFSFETTPLSLSDLKTGDSVSIAVNLDTGTALRILKLAAGASAQ